MTGNRDRALSPWIQAHWGAARGGAHPLPSMREGAHRAWRALPRERDGVDVAPVVGLVAVGGAAVAEEPCRIGIGAVPEVLDPVDAGRGEAGGGITGGGGQGGLPAPPPGGEPLRSPPPRPSSGGAVR